MITDFLKGELTGLKKRAAVLLLVISILISNMAACAGFPASPETCAGSDTEVAEDGTYTSKEDVSLYIRLYGRLPSNFMTREQARELGWSGGSLEQYAPGKCIGGNYFGNYEGLLPAGEGRVYRECDIDTLGKESRGAKRIVFSDDGLIYYTEDHYISFILLYGDEDN